MSRNYYDSDEKEELNLEHIILESKPHVEISSPENSLSLEIKEEKTLSDDKESGFYDDKDDPDLSFPATSADPEQSSSNPFSPPFGSQLEVKTFKLPASKKPLSKLLDLIGVSPEKTVDIRSFYINNNYIVPSIYYEQESKKLGLPKGFTTLSIFYSNFSNKNLFKVYEGYREEKFLLKEKGILSFTYWAFLHFNQMIPPFNWIGNYPSWQRAQKIYRDADLRTLTHEQRKDFEVNIINGLCYVRPSHPNKIFYPTNTIKFNNESWVLMNSAEGKKLNRRGESLIFVLVEDQKRQKKLLVASDIPGVFHHSSFNDGRLKILSAGTMIVRDGVITKITDESGHYRPNSNHFNNLIGYLEDHNAISNQIEIEHHTKELISNHFSLYLISKFDPDKCEIKGNAVILDNKNNTYFVKNGQLVLKDVKKEGMIISEYQKEEKINRQGIPLCTSEEPVPTRATAEKIKKVVHEAVLKGAHFLINVNKNNLTPGQVKRLRARVSAQRKWEFLANNVSLLLEDKLSIAQKKNELDDLPELEDLAITFQPAPTTGVRSQETETEHLQGASPASCG